MKRLIFLTLFFGIALVLMSTTSVRNARLVSNLSVYENLVTPTTSTFIEINGLNETVNYRDGSTRTDADNVYADTVLNVGTLDLTSLTNLLGETLNLTDDIVVAVKFKVDDDAGAYFTISQGAATPYLLLGTTYSIKLLANQSLLYMADTALAVVSNTAKHIDYTSGGSNDTTALYIILVTADGYQ